MSEALTPLLVVFDELDYIACQWEGTSLGNMFCISGLICKPLFCSLPSSLFIFLFYARDIPASYIGSLRFKLFCVKHDPFLQGPPGKFCFRFIKETYSY